MTTRKTREEISNRIVALPQKVGAAHRMQLAGIEDPVQIAQGLQLAQPHQVRGYLDALAYVLTGEEPESATYRMKGQRLARNLLGDGGWSRPADAHLRTLVGSAGAVLLESVTDDSGRDRTVRLAERGAFAWIYSYSYSHYLLNPVVPADAKLRCPARTRRKVGRTSCEDAFSRIHGQKGTSSPEPFISERIYEVPADMSDVEAERQFHRFLRAAGHSTEMREWFLTSVEFLDEIAHVLGLATSYEGGLSDIG